MFLPLLWILSCWLKYLIGYYKVILEHFKRIFALNGHVNRVLKFLGKKFDLRAYLPTF
jgi:hypothetical protein